MPLRVEHWNSAEPTHGEKLLQLAVSRSWISLPVLLIDFPIRLAKVCPTISKGLPGGPRYRMRTPTVLSSVPFPQGLFSSKTVPIRLIGGFESPWGLSLLENANSLSLSRVKHPGVFLTFVILPGVQDTRPNLSNKSFSRPSHHWICGPPPWRCPDEWNCLLARLGHKPAQPTASSDASQPTITMSAIPPAGASTASITPYNPTAPRGGIACKCRQGRTRSHQQGHQRRRTLQSKHFCSQGHNRRSDFLKNHSI
jgi:hypothetical protein